MIIFKKKKLIIFDLLQKFSNLFQNMTPFCSLYIGEFFRVQICTDLQVTLTTISAQICDLAEKLQRKKFNKNCAEFQENENSAKISKNYTCEKIQEQNSAKIFKN